MQLQKYLVAHFNLESLGQRLADNDRVRFGNEGIERIECVALILFDAGSSEIIAEGRFGKGVNPQQR